MSRENVGVLRRFFHSEGHQPGEALPRLDILREQNFGANNGSNGHDLSEDPVPLQITGAGFRSADQLAQENESSRAGQSSLMIVADALKDQIVAAERQHAQSLQEVIDAQDNTINRFQASFETAKEMFLQASKLSADAAKILEDAYALMVTDVADTNRHIKKLKAIRLKPGDQVATKPSVRPLRPRTKRK